MSFSLKGRGHVVGGHAGKPWIDFLRAVSAGNLRDAASVEAFEPSCFDQGSTSSCEGHAGAAGAYAACGSLSYPLPFVPSPDGIYRDARCLDRADAGRTDKDPLVDMGTTTGNMCRAMSEWGVRPIRKRAPDRRFSDVDPATVNEEPRIEDLEVQARKLLVGEYQLFDTGNALVTAVRATLDVKRVPLVCALSASTGGPFQNWSKGMRPMGALPGQIDHAVLITSYRTESTGLVFRGLTSWSAEYGDGGHFEGDSEFIKSCVGFFPMTIRLIGDL